MSEPPAASDPQTTPHRLHLSDIYAFSHDRCLKASLHNAHSPSTSQLVITASLIGPELSTQCLSFPATPQIAQETVSSFEFGGCVGSVLHTFPKTQEILLNFKCA